MNDLDAQEYIFKVISHLNIFYSISFFINPIDYDALYSWYDKKIPLEIIYLSLDNVIKRRRKANKPLESITTFNYEIKKNYKGYLDRKAGSHDVVESKGEKQISQEV